MKTIAPLLLAAAALTSACGKNNVEPTAAIPVQLRICAETPQTRATSLEDKKINSLQVFIFSKDGTLESSKRATGSSVDISSLTGEKIIWAVTNAPEISLSAGDNETMLKATKTDLKDNSSSSLVMTGRRTYTVSGSGGNLAVNVDRIPAKVSLGSIRVDFAGTPLEGKSFVVKDVYLRNVVGEQNIGCSLVPTKSSLWYNRITRSSQESILADTGLSVSCPEGVAKDFNYVYLAYPNPTADDVYDNSWTSVRRTHLMIHASIGGKDSWYPVPLPVIERNHIYNVKTVTLTMKGNDNESDPPIQTGGLGLSVTVNQWTGEDEISYSL